MNPETARANASKRWTLSPEQRFWRKVRQTEGCWEWLGAHDGRGYGLLWLDRRWTGAHRFSYKLHIGSIPKGMELDHLCRNKGCCRPDHLEAVTHLENMRRSDPASRRKRQPKLRTHCRYGHPAETGVSCRACANQRNREYRARVAQSRRQAA